MPLMRSLLIVPANKPDLIEQAHTSNADVVVLDLASGVPLDDRETARGRTTNVIASLKAAGKHAYVRVNGSEADELARDLSMVVIAGLDGLIFCGCREPRDIRQLDVMIREQETRNLVRPGTPQLLIEISSARALLRCQEIVEASTRSAGLVLNIDAYLADIAARRSEEGRELDFARQMLVNVCTATGRQALESSAVQALMQQETALARLLGIRGKYVRSASDIDAINAAFSIESD